MPPPSIALQEFGAALYPVGRRRRHINRQMWAEKEMGAEGAQVSLFFANIKVAELEKKYL